LRQLGLQVSEAVVAAVVAWRLVLHDLWEPQFQEARELQQPALRDSTVQAWRLALPGVWQPQLRVKVGLQHEALHVSPAIDFMS